MLDNDLTMEKLLTELRQIGFTEFIHLDKDKRDGKKRWTWTCLIENEKEWFTALLVEDKGRLLIERLTNPLKKTFEENQIIELIGYIRTEVIEQSSREH